MPFTSDPTNNPIDRIRLMIGDTDECDEGLTDEVYTYLLTTYPTEKQAALEALKYLVAKYAGYVTEKAGGLFVKGSDKHKQYSDLLDKITKDPSFSFLKAGTPFAGGIYKDDMLANSLNPNANRNPLHFGQFAITRQAPAGESYNYEYREV